MSQVLISIHHYFLLNFEDSFQQNEIHISQYFLRENNNENLDSFKGINSRLWINALAQLYTQYFNKFFSIIKSNSRNNLFSQYNTTKKKYWSPLKQSTHTFRNKVFFIQNTNTHTLKDQTIFRQQKKSVYVLKRKFIIQSYGTLLLLEIL